ncbi:MAG: sensor histidine kinase [Nocardioides sp.]
MRTSAHPVAVDGRLAVVTSACAVGLACVTVLLTAALLASELRDPSLPDSAPPGVAVAVVVLLAAVVPAATVALGARPLEAVGLASTGITTCLPLWAGWTSLPASARLVALAAGPVAVGGFSLMVGSRAGLLLAVAAGALHVAAYNPFRDVACVRVCLDVPARLDLSTVDLTRAITLLVAAAATLTVVAGSRGATGSSRAASLGAALLAGLAVVRWRTVGDPEVYARLLLAAPAVPGLVAVPGLLGWARRARARHRVRRLVAALSTDPARIRALGDHVDLHALSPGELLAWRNAELLALAQARAADIRSSQRRIVAAADAERYRIERDLHDGAQQRLVGVLMQLPGLGLETVDTQVRRVLDDLRNLGDRGFPRVLGDEGLGPALEELASRGDAALQLDLPPLLDVGAEQARAVYALVAGTATDGEVSVTIRRSEDGLAVHLQGVPHRPPEVVGDRFGALGGRIEVRDDEVRGVLPCAW